MFPRRGNISLLQNYFIVKVILKTMWGETECLMLSSWSVLFVSGRLVRWQGGRYLVLFKDGGHKMSPRFHLFVSDVNQRNQGVG